MADELKLNLTLSFVKGNANVRPDPIALSIDVSGSRYVRYVQTIGFAAEEAIELGDIGGGSNQGYCLMRNMDATNYVNIRAATGGTNLIKLKAGEIALFRLASAATAPYAIADTGNVDLEVLLFQD